MGTFGGANIAVDGLVFGYDTGYPSVSANHELYKFNKGEPTTTFDVGDMTPSSPDSSFTSNAVYHYNMHGTVWDWTYYPNSNISDDGGMEWHPEVKGPGFKGAWLMKKRPGGNSESNFSGTPPGALDETSPYTVSVWCKTSQASCFRIHINTTKNGSSYWGYASGYHSGGGDWERLSVTLPANAGNTSMNTIRCQATGTTITADAYFRNYQVEKNSHATPFILGGTRSSTQSLIDLKRTTDIDLPNVSFDSNAQMIFDGTDDRVENIGPVHSRLSSSATEAVFKAESIPSSGYVMIFGYKHVGGNYSQFTTAPITLKSDGAIFSSVITSNEVYRPVYSSAISTGRYYHVVLNKDTVNGTLELYVNGSLVSNTTFTASNYPIWQGIPQGTNYLEIGGLTTTSGWDKFLNGSVPIGKLYSRTITAQEVQQNYNAYKNRFNL